MRLVNKKVLEKLRRKNRGDNLLHQAIDRLIRDIEANEWRNKIELNHTRPDAERVHSDGFYFFDLNIHRSMVLVQFDDGEATIVWVGNHQEYEATFKNNKATIKKWLSSKDWI